MDICRIVAIVLIVIVISYLIKYTCEKELFALLNSSKNLNVLDDNKCSTDCCGEQWGSSTSSDNARTNLTCSGPNGIGCLCVSNEERDFLASRGANH